MSDDDSDILTPAKRSRVAKAAETRALLPPIEDEVDDQEQLPHGKATNKTEKTESVDLLVQGLMPPVGSGISIGEEVVGVEHTLPPYEMEGAEGVLEVGSRTKGRSNVPASKQKSVGREIVENEGVVEYVKETIQSSGSAGGTEIEEDEADADTRDPPPSYGASSESEKVDQVRTAPKLLRRLLATRKCKVERNWRPGRRAASQAGRSSSSCQRSQRVTIQPWRIRRDRWPAPNCTDKTRIR
jgi:hypothetical protein